MQVDKADNTGDILQPEALFNLNDNPREEENGNMINEPAYQKKIDAMFAKYNSLRTSKKATGRPE